MPQRTTPSAPYSRSTRRRPGSRESAVMSFGMLHFGDHNINAGVREFQGEEPYQAMVEELSETFGRAVARAWRPWATHMPDSQARTGVLIR